MVPRAHPSPHPNSISIGSAIFVGFTIVTERQTDRPTDHATPSVTMGCIVACSTVMWPINLRMVTESQNTTTSTTPLSVVESSLQLTPPQGTVYHNKLHRHKTWRMWLTTLLFHNHNRDFSFNCFWTILSLWTVCCLSGLVWFSSLTCSKTELFEIHKSSGAGCLRARCASGHQPTVSKHWKKLKSLTSTTQNHPLITNF